MRKLILAIIGGLGVIGGVVSSEFGLTVSLSAVFLGIGAALLYVFGEMKLDFRRVASQVGKFKDPKFWTAILAALVGYLGSVVTLPVPPEYIVAVLGAILALLFKKDAATV